MNSTYHTFLASFRPFVLSTLPEIYHYLSQSFNEAIKKTGVKRTSFHSLRHTFASWLVQKEVRIQAVSKLLGHSSIKTTEIYAHLNNENLRKSTDVLDKIDLE